MTDDIYIVQSGDTLSGIAATHATTVSDLARINGLANPNRLRVGQHIYVKAEKALAVRPLFLDAARNPIRGMKYRLECGTDTKLGVTQANGLGEPIVTQRPTDTVSIWAQIPWNNNLWKQIARTESGLGEKLVTLISPKLRIKSPLRPHPKDVMGSPKPEGSVDPNVITKLPRGTPQVSKGTPQSEITPGGPGVRSRAVTDKNGISREILSEDLPDLRECFAAYTGDVITIDVWTQAAQTLGCEIAVVKALAAVESSGGGFIKNSGNPPLPKILYERTHFSDLTNGQYDADNADLSMPSFSRMKKLRKNDLEKYKENQEIIKIDKDKKIGYVWGMSNYKRFLKACLLNENAAIDSCSWGMFQILGSNWQICDFTSRREFLKAAFTSDRAHLELMFVPFASNVAGGSLKKALQTKDWVAAARIYNGNGEAKPPRGFKGNWVPYHTRLQKSYESYKDNV